MYKIFHNHETGVITIGETIPEGARIQCLDLATAQNTVRAPQRRRSNRRRLEAAAHGLFHWTEKLGLGQ